MTRWIKIPGPGQFRSQGEWREVNEENKSEVQYWEYCRTSGWLPVHESDEKPDPDFNPEPS
jgi:hypothetical protein